MHNDETRFDRALELITDLQTLNDLRGALDTVNSLFGTAHLGYQALQIEGITRAELPIIATCDPEWIRRYKDSEFVEIDPVAKAARGTSLPIDWANADHISTEARRYFYELSRFDIGRRGMGIPIHGPKGNAIFTFTSQIANELEWQSFRRRNKPELYLLAHYFHDKVIALIKGDPNKAILSRQERNCLELSAQGYNAPAIAGMLGLSIHTARMHLSRAQKRLDAHSRTEAVAKALDQGLIRNGRHAIVMAITSAATNAAFLFEIPLLLS